VFNACLGTITSQVYQPPAFGTTPTDGAQLYTDSNLTTTFTPATAGIFLMQRGGSDKWAVYIGPSGIVGAVTACSGVPSVTPASSISRTPSVTPTKTPTISITRTPSVTPAPSPLCECWTVANDDTRTIRYSVINCNGTVSEPTLLPSGTRNHCLQAGTAPQVISPEGGLLLDYECGTNCLTVSTCAYCGPSTAPVLTTQGYQTCSGTTLYTVFRDTNKWSATFNNYYVNSADVGTTAPAAGNATQNWVNEGAVFCSECVSYQTQRQTNPCAAEYNTTRNVNLGAGAPCNYNATWANNGAVFCSDCVSYQPQINTNPCFTGTQTRNVNLGAGAPCNYAENWVNRDINTYYVCVGYDKYYQQIDNNPCSATYNTTRTGALYEVNSPDCGYTPIGIFASAAFATYNEFTGEWTLFVSVTLDGNVNTSTVIDSTVNVAGGQQTFGVTIASGASSGTSANGYLFDPEPVSANCLTFVSGDTRVTTAGYTCP
jgi:hypothetical protein